MPVRLVAVDGWGASGKTTFAARLARALGGAPIVHTDDVASHDRPLDWWSLLEAWVLEPLAEGRPGRVEVYDWVRRRRGPAVEVPVAHVVVLEGVSAARRAVRDRLTCAVWIATSPARRRHRAWERDGPEQAEFWALWAADEEAFYAADPVWEHADLVVDGEPTVAHDPEQEFVILPAAPWIPVTGE